MRFVFKKKKIELLYTEARDEQRYEPSVVDAFFEIMAILDAARDERDLYAVKSLRFEKLEGKRKDERSLRLNKQWRLTLAIESDKDGKYILILDIEDYH